MNGLERVFFHELGHYVAQTLNCLHYHGKGVDNISIYPCAQNPNEYCGHTTPIRPEGYDEKDRKPPPIHRLAENLASLVYGCFFQCYLYRTDPPYCFKTHGDNDAAAYGNALKGNRLGSAGLAFTPVDAVYFQYLVKNKSLEAFFELNPQDYLVLTKQFYYEINLVKLERDTKELIEGHYSTYKLLIDAYNSVIQKHSSYYWVSLVIQQLLSLKQKPHLIF